MSQKNNDRQGRFRSKVVAFRVSPEEWDMIERKLSGCTKQDYFIDCVLDKEITVQGNPYVYRNLYDEIKYLISLYESEINPYDKQLLDWVIQISSAMKEEKKTKIKVDLEGPRQ